MYSSMALTAGQTSATRPDPVWYLPGIIEENQAVK